MPVKLEDRPTQAVREEVIDQLIMNYSHGVISLEAFERRLDDAMETNDNVKLKALVEDLTLQVDEQYLSSKESDLNVEYGYGNTTEAEQDKIFSILGDKKRHGPWLVGKRIEVTSILSDVTLDFSEARFTSPTVTIVANTVLSDLKIKVPQQINVVTDINNIIGGVKNKAQGFGAQGAPTIYIEGYCVLADVKISVKREARDKWLHFAESLKRMFS